MNLQVVSSFFIALLSALVLGPIVVPQLHKLKFGQAIREEGPKAHFVKSGTPTMGGLIIFVSFLAPILIGLAFEHAKVVVVLVSTAAFAAIGFADDYIKVVQKHNQGLLAKQKLILQLSASAVVAILVYRIGGEWWVPFINAPIALGIFMIPLNVFWIVGFDNAVNLTDGLDGLAASVTFVVAIGFAIFSYFQSEWTLVLVNLSMAGALLGYLRVNWHPAKVFMGDTGSLGLGGYVVAMSLVLNIPLVLLLMGVVYVIETLSVIIQVGYYKKTKKRFFKMAPIHHHFEMLGWKEKQIVLTAAGITLIMLILSMILYSVGGLHVVGQ